jgi:hypothetical protein
MEIMNCLRLSTKKALSEMEPRMSIDILIVKHNLLSR